MIEILSIQLPNNPNIVGFTVGGEKIVTVHYMDDITIAITQSRCFKQVMSQYEEASVANAITQRHRAYGQEGGKEGRVEMSTTLES